MNWQQRIIIDPGILAGKPVVKGTRLAVEFIIDLPAQGWTEAELLRNYPGLTCPSQRKRPPGESGSRWLCPLVKSR